MQYFNIRPGCIIFKMQLEYVNQNAHCNSIKMKRLNKLLLIYVLILCSCSGRTEKKDAVQTAKDTPAKSNHTTTEEMDTVKQVFHFNRTDSITIGYLKNGKTCKGEAIYFNNKLIFCDTINEFVYGSKYNRVMTNNNNVLLFIESVGLPNFNHILGYEIGKDKAKIVADCVYNDKKQGNGAPPFTDMDKDGFPEFGGIDLTEQHPSPDSMYYVPSEYYEIKNGKIYYDSTLTQRMDIKLNGIYLKKANGITIAKPKR